MINFKAKAFLLGLISLIILILILTSPEGSYKAAFSGLQLWFNIVFPSLLPFFIVSEFISATGIIDFIAVFLNPLMKPLFRCSGSSSFIWVMSALSGYPSSARLVSLFVEKKSFAPEEGQRVLAFSSTSGPLFMVGAVAVGMLGSIDAGKAIVIGHYLSAFIVGFAFRYYKSKSDKKDIIASRPSLKAAISAFTKARNNDGRTIGELLGDSVRNSVNILLMVGGFIILFSVIIDRLQGFNIIGMLTGIAERLPVLKAINDEILEGLLGGIFEITVGCKMISEAYVPLAQKTAAVSFLIGWSGLSIHAQSASLLNKTGISLGLYFVTKLVQGIIASLISYIAALAIFPGTLEAYNPSDRLPEIGWKQYFQMSAALVIWLTLALLSLCILVYLVKVLKYNSYRKFTK